LRFRHPQKSDLKSLKIFALTFCLIQNVSPPMVPRPSPSHKLQTFPKSKCSNYLIVIDTSCKYSHDQFDWSCKSVMSKLPLDYQHSSFIFSTQFLLVMYLHSLICYLSAKYNLDKYRSTISCIIIWIHFGFVFFK